MGDKASVIPKCYIGTYKRSAGIFLSKKIIERRPYGGQIKVEEFKDYDATASEFFERYPELEKNKEFRLNKLYNVKEEPKYDVYYCDEWITIQYNEVKTEGIVWDSESAVSCRKELLYDEAQDFARETYAAYKGYTRMNFKIGAYIRYDESGSEYFAPHIYKPIHIKYSIRRLFPNQHRCKIKSRKER